MNQGYNRQVVAAMSSVLGVLCFGTFTGYSSPAVPSMQRGEGHGVSQHEITDSMASWIGSLNPLGALVGSLCAGFIIDLVGRKRTLVLVCAPGFVVAWILIGCSVHIAMLYVGRFLGGVICGFSLVTNSVYIVETVEPQIRGMIGSLPQVFMNTGVLVAYGVGTAVNWQLLALVCGALVIPFFLCTLLIPESPIWLMQKGRRTEAERSLIWLRQKDLAFLTEEIKEIENSLTKGNKEELRWKDLTQPIYIKSFLTVLAIFFFKQMSGINAVTYFCNPIFEAAGSSLDPNVCTVLVGAVQVIMTFLASQLVDRLGRRILLFTSFLSLIVSLVCLGLFFFWMDYLHNEVLVSSTAWLPLVSVLLFISSFSIGIGGLAYLMSSELLPSEIRSVGIAIAQAFNWLMAFVVTETFLPICNAAGTYTTFWIFAGACAFGFIFTFFVPETKGKTLEEIREFFN